MSRRRIKEEQGQTMVEFALVLPLLLMIVFAIFQFGVLYNNYVTLTDATRVGARKAAVSRQSATPKADAEAALRKSAKGIDSPCAGGAGLCVSVAASTWEHGQDAVVQATYPYKVDLLGVVVASGQLKSTTTERIE